SLRAPPRVRVVVVIAVLLVSAAMFLPLETLEQAFGRRNVRWLGKRLAGTPFDVSVMAHFLAFAGLAAVLWLSRPDWRGWRAVGVLVALAVAGELMQGIGAYRQARLDDVFTNLLGSAAGLAVALPIVWWRGRGPPPPA